MEDSARLGLHNIELRIRSIPGADMQIESSPGAGTKITIVLPQSDNDLIQKEEGRANEGNFSG